MDLNQLNALGIITQLPWVDQPYYSGGQLHRHQRQHNQFQTTSGWAAQIVGAPGHTALPASHLGGGGGVGVMPQIYGYGGPQFEPYAHGMPFSRPSAAHKPGFGPERRKKKKKTTRKKSS